MTTFVRALLIEYAKKSHTEKRKALGLVTSFLFTEKFLESQYRTPPFKMPEELVKEIVLQMKNDLLDEGFAHGAQLLANECEFKF